MTQRTPEQRQLLEQVAKIAEGLGQTLAPFCEVVVHDLLDPSHAVLAIHNNLSGREVGQGATELGLARIQDPGYEQVIANYPNQFADGRQAKSTSIGIRDSEGRYIAALCMNVDLTMFQGFQSMLNRFAAVSGDTPAREMLAPMGAGAGADTVRARIDLDIGGDQPLRLEPAPGTPEQFAAFIRSETDKWAKVVRATNMKPE